jgi:hypothetical protein
MSLVARNYTAVAANLAAGNLPIINASAQHRVILFNNSATDPATNINTDSTIANIKTTATAADELASSLGGSNYVYSSTFYNSGQPLSSMTWARSSNVWTMGCANPAWTTAGSAFNPAYAVFGYWPSGTPADTACYGEVTWNFSSGAAIIGGGGTYTLSISGSGLLTLTGTG